MGNNLDILIIGSNGQLASEFRYISKARQNSQRFTFSSKDNLDISNQKDVEVFFRANNFDIVINCSAYNAVDKAETEEKTAMSINHIGVNNLAKMAKYYDHKLIHISTDYVFDGLSNTASYDEDIQPNPKSVYGKSKLYGENAILEIKPKSMIIRTSWLFSEFGENFVKKILTLGSERDEISVIDDQIGSPTYARDLACHIYEIITSQNTFSMITDPQIFHYSNKGSTSWYGFAKEILKLAEIDCIVNPIDSLSYNQPAPRPKFSLLDCKKIEDKFAIHIRSWQESLKCLMSSISTSEETI
tara:strand:- start:47125 stop:48027 length:903 start_codon:yes stop_codon:yes gene_type:complete